MYRAKDRGRNGYYFYNPTLEAPIHMRLSQEKLLRRALEYDQFVVYYQPQLDVASGEIVSVEALVRWIHPKSGLIEPSHFIPSAEISGLIVPLGDWVLQTAAQASRSAGTRRSGRLRLAVNLSARQFHQRDLRRRVLRALEIAHLDPSLLEVEITETVAMSDAAQTVGIVRDLKASGIRTAVDDFGTGYSSLAYLRRFSLDVLKIDGSFVVGLGHEAFDETIVKTVIGMAHSLGLEVVAEGVETLASACVPDRKRLRYDAGYALAPPLPAGRLRGVLPREARGVGRLPGKRCGMISTTPRLDRESLIAWYRRNRERSAQLFALIDEAAYTQRPIPLRHPFIFYEGHLPAFSFLILNERGLRETPIDPALERLFERGIDPARPMAARSVMRAVVAVARTRSNDSPRVRRTRRDRARECAALVDPAVPRLVRGQAAYTILEHEPMHHETLATSSTNSTTPAKGASPKCIMIRPSAAERDARVAARETRCSASIRRHDHVWMGQRVRRIRASTLPAFSMQRYPVTNADWLAFVKDGGRARPSFGSSATASSCCAACSKNCRFRVRGRCTSRTTKRARTLRGPGCAFRPKPNSSAPPTGRPPDPTGRFPWGDAPPIALHGNFDFERFDPEPVDAHPGGASAWEIEDLVGNGWEWTSTPFGPFPGFEPMASYPGYSADFFDGKHYVMKGASPVTARELIRPSFRNWFYGDYPYMYAKFRCVA